MTGRDGTVPESGARTRAGGHVVVWRSGTVDHGRAHRSAVARDWVRSLVVDHALFAWPGFDARAADGKPRFAGDVAADFSVSYSGTQVLVGVAVGARIGVDVERLPFPGFDLPRFRRRMCTAHELDRAATLHGPAVQRYLGGVWTAKEALLKAAGVGLAGDLRRIESRMPIPADTHREPRPAAHIAVLDDAGRATLLRPWDDA